MPFGDSPVECGLDDATTGGGGRVRLPPMIMAWMIMMQSSIVYIRVQHFVRCACPPHAMFVYSGIQWYWSHCMPLFVTVLALKRSGVG
jgi:hypothetical protein